MSMSVKDSILSKLMEVEELLKQAVCEGETWEQSMDNDYDCYADSWAYPISNALDELAEQIGYIVEN